MWSRNLKAPQLLVPCWRILREEELVELRRHGRARQHGVCLPAMVDLVDEQMAEDGGHRFPMVDAVVAVNRDDDSLFKCASIRPLGEAGHPSAQAQIST